MENEKKSVYRSPNEDENMKDIERQKNLLSLLKHNEVAGLSL